jgi:hypothetical protein
VARKVHFDESTPPPSQGGGWGGSAPPSASPPQGMSGGTAMEVDAVGGSHPFTHEALPARLSEVRAGRAFASPSRSPSPSDSDDDWVRGRRRARSWSRSVRGGRGPPSGLHDVDARGYSAGGDDSDEVVILGESTTRSQSPYDPAIHTMEEVDVPNSSPVHGEPDLRGGVGVGAWAPPAVDEGMDLDLGTDMAGAGDGARSGVGGLDSGQVRRGVASALPEDVDASARPSAHLVDSRDVVMVDAEAESRRDHGDGARSGIDRGGSMDETAVVPEDAPVDFDTPSVQGQESVSSQRSRPARDATPTMSDAGRPSTRLNRMRAPSVAEPHALQHLPQWVLQRLLSASDRPHTCK